MNSSVQVSEFLLKELVLNSTFPTPSKSVKNVITNLENNKKILCTIGGSLITTIGNDNSIRGIGDGLISKTIGNNNMSVVIGNDSIGSTYGNDNTLVMSGNNNRVSIAGNNNSIEIIGDYCAISIISNNAKFKLDDGNEFFISGKCNGDEFMYRGIVGDDIIIGGIWYQMNNGIICNVE